LDRIFLGCCVEVWILSQRLRYPLLFTALLALLAATWAGLLRIGWLLPTTGGLAAAHGPLMVSGFLGTLIGLERAVALAALGRRWVYIAPILSALGVVTSLLGLPIGPWLLTAGSLALIAVLGEIIRRQPRVDRGLGRDHPPPARVVHLHDGLRHGAVGGGERALAGRLADLPGRLVVGRLPGADHRR